MTTGTPQQGKRSPRSGGPKGKGAEAFTVTPFARLARAHACSAGGDALFAIALADSIFFSIDPNDARWRVALYLLVTAAPFGVVAPWLGPAMDRLKGGNRYMMIGAAGMRALLIIGVATSIDSLLLFPLAFSMLVMGKTHHVAKSALVPGIVKDEEGLVTANSRLSIISALSAATVGVPGVILLRLGGAEWTLGFGAMVFLLGAVLGFAIPATTVAAEPRDEDEKAEMRGAGIVLAASAMGYVRGVVGFLTMLLAFELRGGIDPGPTGAGVEIGHRVREALGGLRLDLSTGGSPAWHFGVVLAATGVGGLVGGIASPRLREMVREKRILAGVLAGVAAFGVLAALSGGLIGAMIAAFSVAIAGQTGKQAFDAIVQRDARGSNLGRSFSRFESRFQLVWVLGALIPVIVPIPARLGFLIVAAASAFAAASYWLGRDPSPNTTKPRAAAKRAATKTATRIGNRRSSTAPVDLTGGEPPADLSEAGESAPPPAAPAPATSPMNTAPMAEPPHEPTRVMPVVSLPDHDAQRDRNGDRDPDATPSLPAPPRRPGSSDRSPRRDG